MICRTPQNRSLSAMNSLNQYLMVVIDGAWSLYMQLHFDFLTRIFIQKKRNRITDRYLSFSIIANKHELVHFQQLSKQNFDKSI